MGEREKERERERKRKREIRGTAIAQQKLIHSNAATSPLKLVFVFSLHTEIRMFHGLPR